MLRKLLGVAAARFVVVGGLFVLKDRDWESGWHPVPADDFRNIEIESE